MGGGFPILTRPPPAIGRACRAFRRPCGSALCPFDLVRWFRGARGARPPVSTRQAPDLHLLPYPTPRAAPPRSRSARRRVHRALLSPARRAAQLQQRQQPEPEDVQLEYAEQKGGASARHVCVASAAAFFLRGGSRLLASPIINDSNARIDRRVRDVIAGWRAAW